MVIFLNPGFNQIFNPLVLFSQIVTMKFTHLSITVLKKQTKRQTFASQAAKTPRTNDVPIAPNCSPSNGRKNHHNCEYLFPYIDYLKITRGYNKINIMKIP